MRDKQTIEMEIRGRIKELDRCKTPMRATYAVTLSGTPISFRYGYPELASCTDCDAFLQPEAEQTAARIFDSDMTPAKVEPFPVVVDRVIQSLQRLLEVLQHAHPS